MDEFVSNGDDCCMSAKRNAAFRVPIHVVLAGTDRLSTLVPSIVHSFARGMSAPGANRVMYRPTDTEDSRNYVHQVADAEGLASLLQRLTGIVIITGHGRLDREDWELCIGDSSIDVESLTQSVPDGTVKADLLIVDACFAERSRRCWRRVLHNDGVLLTAIGIIELKSAAQVYVGLLSAIANRPGTARPTRECWESAFHAVEESLKIYSDMGGAKLRTRDPPYSAFMLN